MALKSMEKINSATHPALASVSEKTTAHSVEIIREEGEDGNLENFGFTVWHGNPPVVGSVVPGSPADRVGLKSNLVILSVNGQPVDHLSQQRVADLIHKTPSRSVWLVVSESAEESTHFRTTLGPLSSHSPKMSAHRYSLRSKSHQRSPRRAVSMSRGVCSSTRVFVHYLGPVEMPPKWSSRGLSLKCIRECVRRIRSVREQHIEVYLVVSGKGMVLQNTTGRTLVTYSRDELFYCGVHMEDECYFGVVTRHRQQPTVDPQVGQMEDTVASRWVHHCHVFKVVQGQSKITMTFGQVSSPVNKEQTTPVRSSQTVVNYIRQLFRAEGVQQGGDVSSGDVHLSPKPAMAVREWPVQNLPETSRVSSNGSTISTSAESSPVFERRKHDLVDLRPATETAVMMSPLTSSHGSPSATTLTSNGSASGSIRSGEHAASVESGLETTGSEPALQRHSVEVCEQQDNYIHSPIGRPGLPPKNSHLSSSMDSVMTSTTTQAENYDNAPQVGSWIMSFDKLLQDPLGLYCFQKFLASEFSDENIAFWKEVERYKSLRRPEQHKPAAQRIYHVFVNPDARQPVNLDGTGVKDIQQRLVHSPPDLFNAAQKQIYNLMRLDSYQRFKRSDVVQKCLLAEMDGRPLPVSLPEREELEEQDKINPLPTIRIEDKSDGSKTAKEGVSSGRGLFSKRSNSFRNNPKASRFGTYFTNESKKKSKTVRDKSRGAVWARVEPEPEGPTARSGFQDQGEDDADHLEVLNRRVGPCFGLALMEKVSKIIPVPKQGSVYDALKGVIRVHKLTFEAIDIRFADNMQPVDLEAAASVLAARYLVVKQSQNYFQAIFPGKEVSVPADPNKTVQQVMDPVLREMELEPTAVTLYVYGARQALSRNTFAGLLKGQKVHVRLNTRSGLPNSLTQGSLSSADSRSSLHSSSGSLSQQPRVPHTATQTAGNTSNNNNNDDDLFSMIFKLQSDTLSEQRSQAPPISALPTSRSSNTVTEGAAGAREQERPSSEPPAMGKLMSAMSEQSLAQHVPANPPPPPPKLSRMRSGSQPSLNESFQEAVTGRRCVSPPPALTLSQDSYNQGPSFNVEVVRAFNRRSPIPPPTQPPPTLPIVVRARSVSPPPPKACPPPLPRRSSSPQEGRPMDPQRRMAHFRGRSPLTITTDASSRGRALSIGTCSREPTPTSGYGSSHSPDSVSASSTGFSQSHLDSFVLTADSHLSSRVRRGSKESSSSSDGTYMSFQQQPVAKVRPHTALHQTHSEPGYPLSQPVQSVWCPPPAHPLWRRPVAPPTEDDSALLRKGEAMLEQEFSKDHSSIPTSQPSRQQSFMYQRFKKVGHKKAVYKFSSPPPGDGSMV